MAATTILFFQSNNGAFKATLHYDDVTRVVSTISYDLTAGTAVVVYDGSQRVTLPGGVGRTVPVSGTRALQTGMALEFVWSSA